MMRRKLAMLLIVLALVFCAQSASLAEENGFKATVGDTGKTSVDVYVEPGKTVTLTVNASCDKGSLTYEWKDEQWNTIQGATGAIYKTGAINENETFICYVRDEYGNYQYLNFYVKVENHLSASAVSREDPRVLVGSSTTLKVKASCDKGALTYIWRDSQHNVIEGVTSTSCTTGAIDGRSTYSCQVKDQYGNSASIYFYINVYNKLRACADGPSHFNIKKGESVRLKVEASCYKGNLTYQWKTGNEDIEGATGMTYDTGALNKHASYTCKVSDQYGNTKSVYYSIDIKNDLGVESVGPGKHAVKPGSSLTLKVNPSAAKGDVTCRWYSYDFNIGEAQGTTLTLKDIQQSMQIFCDVSDIYGNTQSNFFDVVIDNKLKAQTKGEARLTVSPNKPFTLSVVASCAKGTLSYEWRRGYVDGEGGNVSYRIVRDANEASLKEDDIEETTYYRCAVKDIYENEVEVEFTVEIDNGFTMSASGDSQITVAPGKDVTAKVKAACKSGSIHYIWTSNINGDDDTSYSTRTLNSETDSCTLKNVTRNMSLICTAYDDYGNRGQVSFTIVTDNALTAEAVGGKNRKTLTVKKGDSVTMKVAASCKNGSLSYRWYRRILRGAATYTAGNTVVGATGNTCTIKDIQAADAYWCRVWDEYGNIATVTFEISLENELTASIKGSPIVWNKKGENVKLQVSASSTNGDVTYQWFIGGGGGECAIKDATKSSYTVANGSAAAFYDCVVEDQFGNRKNLEFLYLPADTPTLAANKSARMVIGEKQGIAAFVFTPSKTGFYTLTSVGTNNTSGYVYDSDLTLLDLDRNSGEQENFLISARLTAGKQYIFIAKYSSSGRIGSFAVTLNTGSEVKSVELELPLLVGQTVTLPDLYGEGSIEAVEGKCLTQKGRNAICADSAGAASVTVVYDGMIVVYNVTVEKANQVLLPAALKQIEDQAFMNDGALKYAEVGEKVAAIGAKAFADSALKQIVVNGSDTSINAKALSGTKAVVLCRKGSAAETFAKKNEITYVYID